MSRSAYHQQPRLWLLALTLLTAAANAAVSTALAPAAPKPRASDELFTGTAIRKIRIEIPKDGLAKLRRYRWERNGNHAERVAVPVTLKEGDTVYTNVAL